MKIKLRFNDSKRGVESRLILQSAWLDTKTKKYVVNAKYVVDMKKGGSLPIVFNDSPEVELSKNDEFKKDEFVDAALKHDKETA